jgi:hypothetical protein
MSFPLRCVNSDLVDIVEITKSSEQPTMTDAQFEQLLCVNLIKNNTPRDLSNIIPGNNGLKVTGGKKDLSGIMINNNDEVIDSELMVMKFDYSNNIVFTRAFPTTSYTYAFAQGSPDFITLYSASKSHTNSCIVVDISTNYEIQNTTDNVWGIDIDRSVDLMFASANSQLNNPLNRMKIEELADPNYIFKDGVYISGVDSSNQFLYASVDLSNKLQPNNLIATIDPTHNFVPSDFTAYRIFQGAFDISLSVSVNSNNSLSQLPLCQSDGSDIVTPSATQFAQLFLDYAPDVPVSQRYNVEITVGGGSIDSLQNDYLTFDGNNLQNNYELMKTGIRTDASSMFIDISNGSIYLSATDVSSNINDIVLSLSGEYLPSNATDICGNITIRVEEPTNRATITSSTGDNFSDATINVFYNCNEALNYNPNGCSILDQSMLINPKVELTASVIVPKTDVDGYFNYYSDSSLNIKLNGDTILVNTDSHHNRTVYSNLLFTPNLSEISEDTDIIYIKVTNKSILSENKPIRVYGTDLSVNDSISNVTSRSVDLSYLEQEKYSIILNTKTITKLNESAAPTNGWVIRATNNTDTHLISDPDKPSALKDDCSFMRDGKDLSFNYSFLVSSVSQNVRSIKRTGKLAVTGGLENYEITLEETDLSFINVTTTRSDRDLEMDEYNVIYSPSLPFDQYKVDIRSVTQERQYNVIFDPRLPFYSNVTLVSPTITEKITFYEIYDSCNGNKLPDLYLKYFTDLSSGLLSSVKTVLINSNPNTSINVTPKICSTLTGTFNGGSDIILSNTVDVDPFFNTNTIIDISGGGFIALELQIYSVINEQKYYIQLLNIETGDSCSNLPQSFETTLYKFDTTNLGEYSSLENFNPFNSSWITDISGIPLRNQYKNGLLNIYGPGVSYDSTVVASIYNGINPINNDFHIIRCMKPLIKSTYKITDINENVVSANHNYSSALLNDGELVINLTDGVYVNISNTNPNRDDNLHFSINADKFSVKFINSVAVDNSWNILQPFTNIINSGTKSSVYSDDNSLVLTVKSASFVNSKTNQRNNYTASVSFDKYRGYNKLANDDNITINRTPTTALFTMITDNSGTFTQEFPKVLYGGEYSVDSIINSNSDTIVISGLLLTTYLSSLPRGENTTQVKISVEAGSIDWGLYSYDGSINEKYDNTEIIQLGLAETTIFGWGSRNILSTPTTISIMYNIPPASIHKCAEYNKVHPSQLTYNTLLDKRPLGLINKLIPGLIIKNVVDLSNTISEFTAYVVVTPPQLKLTYMSPNPNGETSFPENPDAVKSSYYFEHINYTNALIINKDTLRTRADIKLYQKTPTSNFSKYNTTAGVYGTPHVFKIDGNKVNIYYYLGSPNAITGAPFYSETSPDKLLSTSRRVLYSGKIEDLSSNEYMVVSKNGYGYDISYIQQDTGLNNTTPNIFLNITDAFISPSPQIYDFGEFRTLTYSVFDLTTSSATNVSLYQSSVSIFNGAVILTIDKYTTAGTNYSAAQNSPITEVFFIANTRSTFTYSISGELLSTAPGSSYDLNIPTFLRNLSPSSIVFTPDSTFTATNTGITLSALTRQGIDSLKNLLFYDYTAKISSTANYISTPDIMRVNSLFGSSLFRITNNGNVKTPSVTTYSLNLAKPTYLYDTSGESFMNKQPPILNTNNIQNLFNTTANSPN